MSIEKNKQSVVLACNESSNAFCQRLKNFFKEESGVTMIEYALLAGLIAIAAFFAIYNVGQNVNHIFTSVANDLNFADSIVNTYAFY